MKKILTLVLFAALFFVLLPTPKNSNAGSPFDFLTASESITVDKRVYVDEGIITLHCAVQTGGNHSTCFKSDGSVGYVASGSGFKILAVRFISTETTTRGYACLTTHTSADLDNGAGPPTGGQWIYNKDCTGSGTEHNKSLVNIYNGTNLSPNDRGLGTREMSGIDFIMASGQKLAIKLTGHNGGVMAHVYGLELP